MLKLKIFLVIAVIAVVGWGVYAWQQKPAPKPAASQSSKPPVSTSQNASTAAASVPSACAGNASGKLLLVSISQQHLWACDGTTLANQSAVTTGTTAIVNSVDDNTPTGSWQIYGKQTDTYLKGGDANGSWNDYVQYWMPFDGEIGFHDASWEKPSAFGTGIYHTDGSHGCVHLPTAIAAWVYDWAPVGTTVTVES